MKHLIFVLYDSITNSIFDGQIAQPLLNRKKNNHELHITLISYEKNIQEPLLKKISLRYPLFSFIFLQKRVFITRLFLFSAINALHKQLAMYSTYTLIARGPLAGYLCLAAAQKSHCSELIIQARGLLAEEYRFAHKNEPNIFFKLLQKWRTRQYEIIEKIVYGKQKKVSFPITIESVSRTLQQYLIEFFKADPGSSTLAQHDIPQKISQHTIQAWRSAMRKKLNIDENQYVYCYNGSLKPWQCPQETIHYFKNQLTTKPHAFLLILTPDREAFTELLRKELLDIYYKVLTVPHAEVYHYLAVCDAGIIFREKNCINWVSRPTKILEYQAVGLPIIHNNTIAVLVN